MTLCTMYNKNECTQRTEIRNSYGTQKIRSCSYSVFSMQLTILCVCINMNVHAYTCIHVQLRTNMVISRCVSCFLLIQYTVYWYMLLEMYFFGIALVLSFVRFVCVATFMLGFLALAIVWTPSVCIPFPNTQTYESMSTEVRKQLVLFHLPQRTLYVD